VAIPTLESCQIRRNFFDKIASDSLASQVEDFCLSDTDKSFHAVSGNICSFKVAALHRSRLMLLDYPTRLIYCQNEVTHLLPSFCVYNHILDGRNGPGDSWGVGYGRIRIICVGSDTVFVGFDRFFMKDVGFR
jgi:hypothetical protein